jgi:hypothetical protein
MLDKPFLILFFLSFLSGSYVTSQCSQLVIVEIKDYTEIGRTSLTKQKK